MSQIAPGSFLQDTETFKMFSQFELNKEEINVPVFGRCHLTRV